MGAFFLLVFSRNAAAFNIVVNGQVQGRIVIPDQGTSVEIYAAEELQSHILKATGVAPVITRESFISPGTTGHIYLGNTIAGQQTGVQVNSLQPNAFVTRIAESNLYILGRDSAGSVLDDRTWAGTLFGVYDFLESQLGVKWLWPGDDGMVVPRRSELKVSDSLSITKSLALQHTRFRTSGIIDQVTGWSSAEAQHAYRLDEAIWLRRQRFARTVSLHAAHYFAANHYWDQYGQTHPEYFNLLPDGTRRPDPLAGGGNGDFVSMNLSNEGLQSQLIQDWLSKKTAFNPYVDASDNDTRGKDLTPASLALDVRDPALSDAEWNQRVQLATHSYNQGDPNWAVHLGSLSDRYARFYREVLAKAQQNDPNAKVIGLAYANYLKAPIATTLNEDVIIAYTSPMFYPWSGDKRQEALADFVGWANAGASMVLRPNYMLDGHNMPIFFADKYAEDFGQMLHHNLIGTDFDSLTGQWGTQGLNLYVLARKNTRPEATYEEIAEEYYEAFGSAKDDVRHYFNHWRNVSNAVTEELFNSPAAFARDNFEPGHYSEFYRVADLIFDQRAMAEGWLLLQAAVTSARTEPLAVRRVEFLEKGLTHSAITLGVENAARAFRANPNDMNRELYRTTLKALGKYRASIEGDDVSNMSFLRWAEGFSWDWLLAEGGRDFTEPRQATFSHGIGLSPENHQSERTAIGQSFVPFLPLVTGVSVDLTDTNISDDVSTVTLELFRADSGLNGHAPEGDALGVVARELSSLNVAPGVFDVFMFEEPVHIEPGLRYFFRLTLDSPDRTNFVQFAQQALLDEYGPGANLVFESNSWIYHDGVATRDLSFAVMQSSLTDYAANVPEPAVPFLVIVVGTLTLRCSMRSGSGSSSYSSR